MAQLFASLGAAPAPLGPVLMLLRLLLLRQLRLAGCLQAPELAVMPLLRLVLDHSQASTRQWPLLVAQYPQLPRILIQLTIAL